MYESDAATTGYGIFGIILIVIVVLWMLLWFLVPFMLWAITSRLKQIYYVQKQLADMMCPQSKQTDKMMQSTPFESARARLTQRITPKPIKQQSDPSTITYRITGSRNGKDKTWNISASSGQAAREKAVEAGIHVLSVDAV